MTEKTIDYVAGEVPVNGTWYRTTGETKIPLRGRVEFGASAAKVSGVPLEPMHRHRFTLPETELALPKNAVFRFYNYPQPAQYEKAIPVPDLPDPVALQEEQFEQWARRRGLIEPELEEEDEQAEPEFDDLPIGLFTADPDHLEEFLDEVAGADILPEQPAAPEAEDEPEARSGEEPAAEAEAEAAPARDDA
jgi:hypothetical protein